MAQKERHLTSHLPRRVLMVAYPGAHNLDVVGPLETLAATAYFASDGEPHYDIAIVAAEVRPVAASSGLTITASQSFEDVLNGPDNIDTLMIAGGHNSARILWRSAPRTPRPMLRWPSSPRTRWTCSP